MSDRYFLDTNIFIYCFDDTERDKRDVALRMVARAIRDRLGSVSWQVIQEFCNTATRKFADIMTPDECRAYVDCTFARIRTIRPRLPLYREALSVQDQTGYAFYDSLIIAAALDGRCGELYTEDLQHGHQVRGLTIVNPFV